MCVMVGELRAQNWQEWFRQKKTQRKYLVQQIAALKVYLEYLKEGYTVAKKGLNMIGDIKDGNFNSHSEYFGSLKQINPSVGNSTKIEAAIAYQNLITDDFGRLLYECQSSPYLTNEEKVYVNDVYTNLIQDGADELTQLKMVITADDLEMKDDERISKVDAIYESMKDKYTFTCSFSNSTKLLITQRSHEKFEIDTSVQMLNISL
jgi:hypothetical protein